MIILNGNNVTELNQFIEAVRRDPTRADRNPKLTAHWVGGSRSRVECDDKVMYIGGDDELNAMRVLLAALAACDVDVIATHASLMGLEIETLSVEVGGRFNVCAYLGLPEAPGSGYDGVAYTIHARIPGATLEQLAELRRRVEYGSPVGNSLARAIPLKMNFDAHV
ncbi:MAG TPA: OsmC family protein [Anaerolineales bacterium]|nr:OsmC family protein [Anaerolineales bacterium]